jgi:hypothetical protein
MHPDQSVEGVQIAAAGGLQELFLIHRKTMIPDSSVPPPFPSPRRSRGDRLPVRKKKPHRG